MNLTDADVQEIIRLLDGSDYDELEIETERFRLVLRRGEDSRKGWSQQRETRARTILVDAPALAPAPARAPSGGAGSGSARDRGQAEDGLVAIPSPIVGTFYRAPSPSADPFVHPGSRVEPDTVVAIIEVMKLMHSIAAGVSGQVVEILVEDGQLVQKGQCLMRVQPLPERSGGQPG